jgi:Tol biopolymer transport system component
MRAPENADEYLILRAWEATMNRGTAALLAIAVMMVVAPAIADELVRLTGGTEDWRKPSADLRGRHVVYVSSGALFLHDSKKGDVVILAHRDVGDARISGNGKVVVYSSDGDPFGTNADGNEELFAYGVKSSTTTQLTQTTDSDSESPSVDQKGRRIAFRSDADFTGDNPDGSEEIFLLDRSDGSIAQITNSPDSADISRPEIVATGKYVYYSSDADPLGTNADGNREIFRYVVKTGTTEQLTATTTGNCTNPAPSKSGKYVVFESPSEELAGPNADGEGEIYRLLVKKGVFTRVTDHDFDTSDPSVSGNGKIITFQSRGDPLGTNADGSLEIFQTCLKKGVWQTTQITSGENPYRSRRAVLSSNGKRTFLESDADLTGEGAGNEHIFLFVR